MSKRNRKNRHSKGRGPGGPTRPRNDGGSRRVTSAGPVGDDAPTRALVDSLLDGWEPLEPDADAATVAMVEVGVDHILEMFLDKPGPHLKSMLTAVASSLAQRRTPTADAVLAAMARLAPEHGRGEFETAWRARSKDEDVLWAARHHGDDTVTEAIEIGHAQGDGVNLALAVDNPAGTYSVAVYIDHNLGGLAKDLLVGPPIDQMRAVFGSAADGFTVRSVPFDEAYWRFLDAVDETSRTLDPPVSEDFDDYLDVVMRRFELISPDGDEPEDPPWGRTEVTNAERLAHVGAFMSSPEYEALPVDDRDEAVGVVRLWIDHAVDYTIGPARRVSPTLVEIFCTWWFPRKVVADEAMLAVAPAALEAWLRFAARTTELDDRWLSEALDALRECAPEMRRSLDDPSSWGMGKSLLGGRSGGLAVLGDLDDLGGLGVDALVARLAGGAAVVDDQGGLTTTSTSGFHRSHDSVWEPLEAPTDGGRVHVEADPSSVGMWQYAKTRQIAGQVTTQAAALLGPSFAQPAMDIAVALGSIDPSPYDNTQVHSWPGAIIWLLAEDNDAFEPRKTGRRREDLAAELPMTAATYKTKATKIREALGLAKGECVVSFRSARD